jgi:hypothetical protein
MPRWDSKRKPERDAALVQYADNHPDFTYEEIGHAFGITRQRAFEIVKKARQKREPEKVPEEV